MCDYEWKVSAETWPVYDAGSCLAVQMRVHLQLHASESVDMYAPLKKRHESHASAPYGDDDDPHDKIQEIQEIEVSDCDCVYGYDYGYGCDYVHGGPRGPEPE